MLAIVETGGKQYQMQEGRYIDVELLGKEENDSVELDKVVMIVAGDLSQVGQPYVEGAVVKAKVLKNGKDKKIIVYKQRCKKGYRKKQGHRQQFCRIMVESIEFPGKAEVMAAEPKVEAAPEKAAKKAVKKEAKVEKPKKIVKKAEVKTEAKEEKAEKKPAAKKASTKKAETETEEAPKPKKKAVKKEKPAEEAEATEAPAAEATEEEKQD